MARPSLFVRPLEQGEMEVGQAERSQHGLSIVVAPTARPMLSSRGPFGSLRRRAAASGRPDTRKWLITFVTNFAAVLPGGMAALAHPPAHRSPCP
jgi:hypothetical protein